MKYHRPWQAVRVCASNVSCMACMENVTWATFLHSIVQRAGHLTFFMHFVSTCGVLYTRSV